MFHEFTNSQKPGNSATNDQLKKLNHSVAFKLNNTRWCPLVS